MDARICQQAGKRNIIKIINAQRKTGPCNCEYCLSCLWKPLRIPPIYNFIPKLNYRDIEYYEYHFYKYFNEKEYLNKIKQQIQIVNGYGYQTFEILINDEDKNNNNIYNDFILSSDPSDKIIVNQRKMCQS